MNIFYKEPIYRPPSEANSLLIHATLGCQYDCDFCGMYTSKRFQVRPVKEIIKDLDAAKLNYGSSVRRIFLLDGNAFVCHPKVLLQVAEHANKIFPNLNRISAYTHASDVLRRSPEDLKKLSDHKMNMLYLGIETGDSDLLHKINKETDKEQLIEAAQKLHQADIKMSGTIMLGIAGNDPKKSFQHAKETADLINQMKPSIKKPWYISALTTMIAPDTKLEKDLSFKLQNTIEVLQELKTLFMFLKDDLHGLIFRSNHASNYLNLQSNDLSKNKNDLLRQIDYALDHPEVLKADWMRGL
ncbi:MAG: B12-binding domain-containing radical SAM protein [Candidatus Cloacimonetes bacterium]|nr:B12-binding domain-containing radical SAM protein [Candidatus Cloacimonadota bacterium]